MPKKFVQAHIGDNNFIALFNAKSIYPVNYFGVIMNRKVFRYYADSSGSLPLEIFRQHIWRIIKTPRRFDNFTGFNFTRGAGLPIQHIRHGGG
jgi:hypothetical protein